MGIDFHAIKLLEFSFCSLPMNPDCRVLGSVSGATTSPPGGPGDTPKMADLRREARTLAAKARAISESISDPVPTTRDQRLAEARNFRHAANKVGRS
jgi:hypothetical protein